jgi:hypothetical protein
VPAAGAGAAVGAVAADGELLAPRVLTSEEGLRLQLLSLSMLLPQPP